MIMDTLRKLLSTPEASVDLGYCLAWLLQHRGKTYAHVDEVWLDYAQFKTSAKIYSLYLVWKYARIFVRRHYLFREANSFPRAVSFEEQIMSKDKYPNIFSQPNWGYCVYYPSVLKIGEYPRIFPTFSWGIFAHVTRLYQSRASENIEWIIIGVIKIE